MPPLKNISQKLRSGSFSELTRGSFRSFLLRIVGTLVSYVFTVTVTRLLGADVYGVFMTAQTSMMISVMIGRMGIDTVLLRWVSSLRATERSELVPGIFGQALRFVLPVSIALTLLFWVFAPYLAPLFLDAPEAPDYLRWMVLGIVPMTLVFLCSEALRGLKEVEWNMLLRNILPFGTAALLVAVGYGCGASGTALLPIRAFLIGVLIAATGGLLVWRKRAGWEGGKFLDEDHGMRSMVRTGLPLLLSSSMFFIMNDVDILMLGYFMKDADVGIYSVAMRIANLCNVALYAVNMIAAPKFSEYFAQGDWEALNRIVQRATRMVFAVVFPIVLILFIFSGPILGIFGAEFMAGRSTLFLLAIGKFVNAASGSVMYFLQMTQRERVGMRILFCAAIANVVLNLALIPQWGIEGAAIASTFAIAGWNIYGGIYIWKKDRVLTFFWPFSSKSTHDRNV